MSRSISAKETALTKVYYDPKDPGSFGGVQRLADRAGVSKEETRNWLSGQDAYTLHKPVRKKFPTNQIRVAGLHHMWQADLIIVRNIAHHNNNYRYLLVVLDVLSRKAWVVPIKTKTGSAVVDAFKTVIRRAGTTPFILNTDAGTEFTNRVFQKFLKSKEIDFFVSYGGSKAAIAERFIRTLREKLWRYFTKKNTLKYVPVLNKLVNGYNATVHSAHGLPPNKVTLFNESQVWQTMYGDQKKMKKKKPSLMVGDRVRLSSVKSTFAKGATRKWTTELFVIAQVLPRDPPVYRIKDKGGQTIRGVFYEPELQKVKTT